MEGEIDFEKHTESELVDMFGRLDARYAAAECARLGKYLADRGYIVTDGTTGPGSAVPSSKKLQTLIGSPQPIEWAVDFGNSTWSLGLGPAQNEFGFVGSGTMQTDGVSLWLTGRVSSRASSSQGQEYAELSCSKIANVESDGRLVRFGYDVDTVEDHSISLWLADNVAAAKLVAILPKRRTTDFRPQIKADADFGAKIIAQSPKVPVTVALVTINVCVFSATLIAGAEWLTPVGRMQIAWGSNFGPYTTDGEWWRLFTSVFIHFGILHLALNMAALVIFGPLVERLYGSINYLLIFLFSGIAGSLSSLAWRPDVNSAGASGAIYGILGALLAAQLRAGDSFPRDILLPIRNTAVAFLVLSVSSGLRDIGINNAAHLGGLAAGFLIGLIAARPITGASSYSPSDMRRSMQMIPAAAVVLAVGLWFAQRASAAIVGDIQFLRTAHWIDVRESILDRKFEAMLSKETPDRSALLQVLEKEGIPFWHDADDRLAAIRLPRNSPNEPELESLQDEADEGADAYQLLDDGLRKNDTKVIATARQKLKKLEAAVNARRGTG